MVTTIQLYLCNYLSIDFVSEVFIIKVQLTVKENSLFETFKERSYYNAKSIEKTFLVQPLKEIKYTSK